MRGLFLVIYLFILCSLIHFLVSKKEYTSTKLALRTQVKDTARWKSNVKKKQTTFLFPTTIINLRGKLTSACWLYNNYWTAFCSIISPYNKVCLHNQDLLLKLLSDFLALFHLTLFLNVLNWSDYFDKQKA